MTSYGRLAPAPELRHIIECFWSIEGDETKPERQKIIPDAFIELIFHFGDPYRINLHGKWEVQPKSLFAGQISKHFFLENTGTSDIFAIKLRPSAMTHLFGLEMRRFTDKVVNLKSVQVPDLLLLENELRSSPSDDRQSVCESFFTARASMFPHDHAVDKAVAGIFAEHGLINVSTIATELQISERYLEQLFRKFVGLTPKFFSRVVRFNYIFQLIRDNNPDWGDVVFRAGYYDQSHFIRNFKEFTGVDPSAYGFERESMANFFLKKNKE